MYSSMALNVGSVHIWTPTLAGNEGVRTPTGYRRHFSKITETGYNGAGQWC